MAAKLLILTIKPKDLERGLALVIAHGVTTLEEKRVGPDLQLHLQIPKGMAPKAFAKKLRDGEKKFPGPMIKKLFIRALRNESWKKAYQKYLKPFPFPAYPPGLPPILIRPLGPYPRKPQIQTLTIHGRLAFGTGQHPSTQMAGFLMQKAMSKKSVSSLLDVGTGTGILAMVAYQRGLRDIVALENDPEARQVARENFRGNGMREIRLLDQLSGTRRRFPLIVANIIAKTLIELKGPLGKHLKKNGSLILSGLTYRDVPEVLWTYRGYHLIERKNNKGWSALWLESR